MKTTPKTLLVMFAESVLEQRLVADVTRLGAHGYTVWDVRGASGLDTGDIHRRDGVWDTDRTIEMKVVCSREVAERIAEHVLAAYSPHHGISLYLAEVQVFRAQKY